VETEARYDEWLVRGPRDPRTESDGRRSPPVSLATGMALCSSEASAPRVVFTAAVGGVEGGLEGKRGPWPDLNELISHVVTWLVRREANRGAAYRPAAPGKRMARSGETSGVRARATVISGAPGPCVEVGFESAQDSGRSEALGRRRGWLRLVPRRRVLRVPAMSTSQGSSGGCGASSFGLLRCEGFGSTSPLIVCAISCDYAPWLPPGHLADRGESSERFPAALVAGQVLRSPAILVSTGSDPHRAAAAAAPHFLMVQSQGALAVYRGSGPDDPKLEPEPVGLIAGPVGGGVCDAKLRLGRTSAALELLVRRCAEPTFELARASAPLCASSLQARASLQVSPVAWEPLEVLVSSEGHLTAVCGHVGSLETSAPRGSVHAQPPPGSLPARLDNGGVLVFHRTAPVGLWFAQSRIPAAGDACASWFGWWRHSWVAGSSDVVAHWRAVDAAYRSVLGRGADSSLHELVEDAARRGAPPGLAIPRLVRRLCQSAEYRASSIRNPPEGAGASSGICSSPRMNATLSGALILLCSLLGIGLLARFVARWSKSFLVKR